MVLSMTYSETLSAEIRAESARRRITGRDLARHLRERGSRLSHATVARMLRGERPWDVDTLDLVAGLLGVPVVDLLARGQGGHRQRRLAYLSTAATICRDTASSGAA